jgi:hypothetical protein
MDTEKAQAKKGKKKTKDPNVHPAVLAVKVSPVNEDDYQSVLNDIRHYRVACNKIAGHRFMAQAAGIMLSTDEKGFLKARKAPNTAEILQEAFKEGSSKGNPFYDIVASDNPEWLAYVHCQVLRDVNAAVTAEDPRKKISREVLGFGGARGIVSFERQGLPIQRTKDYKDYLVFETDEKGRPNPFRIGLRWRKGDSSSATVWFKVLPEYSEKGADGNRKGKLSKGTFIPLKLMSCGRLEMATSRLSEKDGHLFLFLSYKVRTKKADVDPSRVVDVRFTDDPHRYIRANINTLGKSEKVGMEDRVSHLDIDVSPAILALEACEAKAAHWRTVGGFREQKVVDRNNRRGRRVYSTPHVRDCAREHLANVTAHRTNVGKSYNSQWSRMIVDFCARNRCGTVKVHDLPSNGGDDGKGMMGRPWQFSLLLQDIQYKAARVGIKVESMETPTLPSPSQVRIKVVEEESEAVDMETVGEEA